MTTYAIVHGDDVDGLTCGAFIFRLTGCDIYLANYDNLHQALEYVKPPVDKLYVCDLNIRGELEPQIMRIREFAEVHIIDHHKMNAGVQERLTEAGVKITLDTRDCAGVLCYDQFRDELGVEGARIAGYAIISDMFEDGPLGSEIIGKMDRKFNQHEAQILTHALARNQTLDFRRMVLKELSNFNYPHRIEGAVELAVECLEEMTVIKEAVKEQATVNGRVGYMEAVNEFSTGGVANLIIDTLGVDVGLSYKENQENYNVSLRGEKMLPEHLGELVQTLATKHGGFGGGHKRASGAKIPKENIQPFINDLINHLN